MGYAVENRKGMILWKKKTAIMLYLIILTVFAAGVLKFADEIVTVKRLIYTQVAAWRAQEESKADITALFADYSPMVHTGDEWYQDTQLIYHAGGTIDGLVYTNAKEALENTMAQRNWVVELDFLFTSDGHLICAHEWSDLYALEPVSLEDVLEIGIYRKYTPLTAEKLIVCMRENPELVVITDTKEEQPLMVIAELVELAGEDPDILSRFVVQLYKPDMKSDILKIYPFKPENFLFTAYEFGPDRVEEILTLCFEEDIRVVTVVFHAWEDEVLALCQEKGIVVFEHTVNDAADARGTIARGVQGVYTDFLQPADLLPCEE